MKLEQYIAQQTSLSRRKILGLLNQKCIRVNGKLVSGLSVELSLHKDNITIDGHAIKAQKKWVYYKFNKPRNVICTLSDPKGRRDLTRFIESIDSSLFPVGRLDRQTQGLLILTNDGSFANILMHPKYKTPKRYFVRVDKKLKEADLLRLEKGILLSDGPVSFKRIIWVDNKTLRLEVSEGRNRLIRRAFEALGYEVEKLLRESVGTIFLSGLQEGHSKPLTQREIKAIKDLG